MVILLKTGTKIELPYLISYDGLLWFYNFGGDETYTDDLGVVCYWSGRQIISEILSIQVGSESLYDLGSLSELQNQDQAFYFDEVNQVLYVRWKNDKGDWAQDRSIAYIQKFGEGFSNRIDSPANGYYNDVYYKPILNGMSGFTESVNISDWSLIRLNKANISIDNANGHFDDIEDSLIVGQAIELLTVPNGETDLTNAETIFSGFAYGGEIKETDRNIIVNDKRIFFDKYICQNVFIKTDDMDNSVIGKRIPVAFGKIRRGIMIPLNSKSLKKDESREIVFKLSDESLGNLRAVTSVYDNNGEEVSFTVDLELNTVTYLKPALTQTDNSIDVNRFTWEGEGIEIGSTYNNGLNIIRYALKKICGLAYIESLFDIKTWNYQTALNVESVGLSIQSDKGLIQELIEPLGASLRGSMQILGDGRISFISSNLNQAPSLVVERSDKTLETEISQDADKIASIINVEYSPNFQSKEYLSESSEKNRQEVVYNYALDRELQTGAIETVLTEAIDAFNLANNESDFASKPMKKIRLDLPLTSNSDLLSMIYVDCGRFGNPVFKVFEVIDKDYNYMENRVIFTGRYISDTPYVEKVSIGDGLPFDLNLDSLGG